MPARKKKTEAAVPREKRLMRIGAKALAGGAVGAVGGLHTTVAGAAAGAVTGLIQEVADGLADWRRRRATNLLGEIIRQSGAKGADEVRRQVAALRKKPFFIDAVIEAFKQLDNALDDAVVPSLAALVAEYKEKPVDGFFRGVGRLLADLGAGELQSLCILLGAVAPLSCPRKKFLLSANKNDGTLSVFYFKADVDEGVSKKLSCAVSNARRLFFLLNAHGLSLGPEDDGIALEEDVMRRMARLIRL